MEPNPETAGKDEQVHNPEAAGKKAIEAEKLTNDKDKPKEQQEKDDKADAEQWRNEG